jgi:hypothetical protein
VADGDAERAEALMRRHSGQASAYLEARMTEAAVPNNPWFVEPLWADAGFTPGVRLFLACI